MAYQSLYLTYRPQTFKEVAGQKPIIQTLENALKHNKIAHAYLFAGPRGTGKTTMARLFAKALNCEDGLGHQCCHCSNCLSVKEGNHPDVIEVDAASNNGVEQVRQLIDKVSYSPIKGKYKVYIIDEVHMMTTGAFNALLKTLEEPPANVVFILCTTEPHKVLPTIVSRCQRFDFAKLNANDMTEKLKEVLKSENATYTENGIKTVVNIADGGMRDALSVLDQVLAYSDNNLDEQDVLDIFGLASTIEKVYLLEAISKGDVKTIISCEQTYAKKGIDIRRLTTDLISICKDEIVYKRTNESSLLTSINEQTAQELAGFYTLKELSCLINVLLDAQNNYRFTNDVRTLFDLSLLKFISNNSSEEIIEEPKKKPVVSKVINTQVTEPKPLPVAEKPKIVEPKQPTEVKTQMQRFEERFPEEKPIHKEVAKPKQPVEKPIEKAPQSVAEPPAFLFEDDTKLDEDKHNEHFIKFNPEPVEVETPKTEPKPVKENVGISQNIFDLSSEISTPKIAVSGPTYELDNKTLINIVCLGREQIFQTRRKELLADWSKFDDLKLDANLSSLATLLSQGKPFVYCKSVLLLSYDFENLAKKANIIENQKSLSKMIEKLCGEKLFIYALGPNERSKTLEAFYNLMRIGQLPKNKDITLTLPKDL